MQNHLRLPFRIQLSICILVLSTSTCFAAPPPPMQHLSDTGEECPTDNFDETSIPGYDPANPMSFARNQDTVGNCPEFSGADFICYKLKKLGLWPDTPEYNKGCSALDLQVQSFQEPTRTGPNTISNFIGTKDGDLAHTSTIGRLVYYAKTKGVCPESLFPSEFMPDPKNGLRRVYEAAERHILSASASTEAGVPIEGLCPECMQIGPALTTTQWRQIKDAIGNATPSNDFEVIKKINQISCPPEKRIKLPANFDLMKTDKSQDLDGIRSNLNKGRIGQIDINTTPLFRLMFPGKEFPPVSMHAALLTEAGPVKMMVKISDGSQTTIKKCFYAIKSSWGGECIEPKYDTWNEIPFHCDRKNGKILLSERMLTQITNSITWDE